jgi:hypothetical protein
MIKATSGEPAREFTVPSDIHFATVDPINGAIAGAWVRNRVKVALRSGQTAGDAAGQREEEVSSSTTQTADETITQTMDTSTTDMAGESAAGAADEPILKSDDDTAIKEEELPPE